MKYGVNINLNGHELSNAKIQPLTIAPQNLTSDDIGRIYTDTLSKKLKFWDGTNWVIVGHVIEDANPGDGILEIDGHNVTVYRLPEATSSTLGGVRVGAYLTVTETGILKAYYVDNKNSDPSNVVTGISYNQNENKGTLISTDVKDLVLSGITSQDAIVTDGHTLEQAFDDVKNYVDDEVSSDKISHFLGISDTYIENGSTTSHIVVNQRAIDVQNSDFVLFMDSIYVWYGTTPENACWIKTDYTIGDINGGTSSVVTAVNKDTNTKDISFSNTSVSDLTLSDIDQEESTVLNGDTIKEAFEHTKDYIDESVFNVLHMLGVTVTELFTGCETQTIKMEDETYITAKDADVATYSGYEFMWFDGQWNRFGSDVDVYADEDEHVLEITIL